MKKRVADIIMDTLIERGITDCFAVVGGGAMFLDNALLHCEKMTKYFNHHEQACAMAAEAYTRSSGKLPLVCVTSGPGGTNTLTGVMGAWVDSIPMLVISGQVRYAISVPKSGLNLRTRGVQEFDIVNTVKTMTKYSKLVIEPLDIKMEINKAIDIAMSGRKGPVWLDIPQDVQSVIVEEDELTPNVLVSEDIGEFDIDWVMKELKKAKRPIFLVGGGIAGSNERELFRKVSEAIKIPVVSSLNGVDVLYRENDLFMGPIGAVGQRCANFTVQNSDLIISIGCSLGFSTTGFSQKDFAPKAKIIVIDIDGEELKKPGLNYLKQFVCNFNYALNEFLEKEVSFQADSSWLEYCKTLKETFSPYEAAEGKSPEERVCSYVFWKEFYGKMPADITLILGNNSAITSALQIGNLKEGQHIFTNFNCGSMGYDIPASLGIAIAKKKEVILATGDGSFMMNLQELQTIRHHNLPVKIIIFENAGYNAIRQTSKNFFHGEMIGCTPETGVSFPDFENVAKTFDFHYIRCEKNKDISECLDKLLAANGPTIMEVSQLIDDPVSPKVMSRTDKNGKMLSPALQDMYPFIDADKLKEFMISE